MKKFVVIAITAACLTGSAYAQGSIRDNCGCGLGTMALGDQNPSLVMQLVVTFLNAISGNQTFGITSGTLECEPHAGFASNKRILEYVGDNMDHLVMDIASGSGDSLAALADLMDVPQTARADLYATLQSHFDDIFPSEEVTALDVVKNIAVLTRS